MGPHSTATDHTPLLVKYQLGVLASASQVLSHKPSRENQAKRKGRAQKGSKIKNEAAKKREKTKKEPNRH